MGMQKSKHAKESTLRKYAIQIVAQLPNDTGDAKRVLEMAMRLLEKCEEKKPWNRPNAYAIRRAA